MNFSINEYKGGRLKWGKTPWQKLLGNRFFSEVMFMAEPKSKSSKKVVNDYFCIWTCLNPHGKTNWLFLNLNKL